MGLLNTNWVKSVNEALNCFGYIVICDRIISKQVILRDVAANHCEELIYSIIPALPGGTSYIQKLDC